MRSSMALNFNFDFLNHIPSWGWLIIVGIVVYVVVFRKKK